MRNKVIRKPDKSGAGASPITYRYPQLSPTGVEYQGMGLMQEVKVPPIPITEKSPIFVVKYAKSW